MPTCAALDAIVLEPCQTLNWHGLSRLSPFPNAREKEKVCLAGSP
jgi:hypothetical protein